MAQSHLDVAQAAIGYRFHHPRLLSQALTHKSHVNEIRDKGCQHNERLEFLGDAVLALIISEYLTGAFPNSTEGELSKLKARLVSEPFLAKGARRLELGNLLRLGRGEELTQGREKNSLLANALEAVIAAIYLDGGLEAARAFTLKVFAPELDDLKRREEAEWPSVVDDYKTRIQEWCQKQFETLPQYLLLRESGPDHQKVFEVQVMVGDDILGLGIGRSKKEAEQMAAKEALRRVGLT
ncbi:ribonuclease III [Nitrospira sp. Kam-Ns4a]